MDWKYILSMASKVDELEEGKKDELLNTIAWYDVSEEKLDTKRATALLKLAQEIMKYKSEQVEALLAELDELAVRQAEEEAKTHESDERSTRSKKSLDSDEQDMKYRELKAKYRKLQKQIEAQRVEQERLKQNVKMLEQERVYLQKELRNAQRDDSASDVSEIIKDQQRNLMDGMQQKNVQISQLLTDIENVESDNLQMRAHLSHVRDELADATEKLEELVVENKLLKVKLDECGECCERIRLENVGLREQIDDFVEDKALRQAEFEQFAHEIDVRIEDWKSVLAAKNKEIDQLKAKTNQSLLTRAPSSSSSSSHAANVVEDATQLNVLQKAIAEREDSIVELRKQLEAATKEMLKTTQVLKQVTGERDDLNKKAEKADALGKELKKQLKAAHARSQHLIEDVRYQETLVEEKDKDVNDILNKIEDANLKELMSGLVDLKNEKRKKDKKIADLVKSYNKLQTNVDTVERENASLRERLGLAEDEFISTQSISLQQKRSKKQLDLLQAKLETSEEEKLQYRLELQKLSKIISKLSDQLLTLGETPIINGQKVTTSTRSKEKEDLQAEATKAEYDSLLQENDALRKGLHEILESVQKKQEFTEVKSETLEQLLRALDAKHVSGWYHPAMRLQAELHTLQGSNQTLREQLRNAKEELDEVREKAAHMQTIEASMDSSNATAIANLNNHLITLLKNCHVDDENNVKLVEKLESYKKEFCNIQEHLGTLYGQYTQEKSKWEDDLDKAEDKVKELSTLKEMLEEQLGTIKLFNDPQTEEETKIKRAAEMSGQLVILNRKIVYLENADAKCKQEIDNMRRKWLEEKDECWARMNKYKEENLKLSLAVTELEQKGNSYISDDFIKLQNDYDNLLIKQRDLQRNIDIVSKASSNELEQLQQKVTLLQQEKQELADKLVNSRRPTTALPDDIQKLLAQSEINETTERQRANHMNSLYELVKEQLDKAEERHKEFQKYNNEIMQKNIVLQESVKQLEDKLLTYVDVQLYDTLQTERAKLADECCTQRVEMCALRDELSMLRQEAATRSLWSHADQYELHSLKHLIVDLQATGDDKAVIARLSSDVVSARLAEAEIRKKLDEMVTELTTCRDENVLLTGRISEERAKLGISIDALRRRISNLELIIHQQRNHYLGYVPFISEEKLIQRIGEIAEEKERVHKKLEDTVLAEHECNLVKETLEAKTDVLNELNQMIRNGDEQAKALEKWFLDKTNVQLQELRCRRQAEFKETQLKHALARLQEQDEQIAQLEAELLQSLCLRETTKMTTSMTASSTTKEDILAKETKLRATRANIVEIAPDAKEMKRLNADTQTSDGGLNMNPAISTNNDDKENAETCALLRVEISQKNEEIHKRTEELQACRQKILELEMSISLLRQQMGDKQSQINFYEKHILEMQQQCHQKKEAPNADVVAKLQKTIGEKEHIIYELQSLLKKDRDEHSLAALRFQEELKHLQTKLSQQQEQHVAETQKGKPARAAVEYYIQQVHALEKLTGELQTSASTLNTQLQASREECNRWRDLANDRLQSVDELRINLEEQHKSELESYKAECEKWRSEVGTLQLYINTYKKDIIDLRPNIEKELKDKDNKIHELLITLRQLKTELRRKSNTQAMMTVREAKSEENFDEIKENLLKEQEILKKRCEQLLNKEKNAREEIRNLKGQLMKRPALSARSDAAGGSSTLNAKEQQLQKKAGALEKEVEELREKLEREVALNEAHKAKVNVDFDKWNKQKYWQQTAEKMKSKLKEKTEECDKLQTTCSSYRMLIERLEREKHNLEVRVKNLKGNYPSCGGTSGGSNAAALAARYELVASENAKLEAEIGALKVKLEQQQHHAGALSSVMLQDKLEAQERKIAVLEMSAKGGGEMRSELERLHNANATLQKSNLRLEADNLDLRLDLEKSTGELPHLREQINYLENYINVLKTERDQHHEVTNAGDHASTNNDTKRVAELERTVFVLKRVVEKLQVENKRLVGGGNTGGRSCSSDRTGTADRIKRECNRLREQYDEKIAALQRELRAANERAAQIDVRDECSADVRRELDLVKGQLEHKAQLLDKVKVLLQRAAHKERSLLQQVSSLKAMIDTK